ncbi:Protein bicaudal C like protein 1-B [Melipona quadrifasciata]|uniref:Protein bicaudal C like protein 1-B n=1 Tax=Melipona quadrifasciata TaxID=166423 RepID=A0A0N0BK45_9HYME|nr:Protein bicaudal C like protein 1-B [Melipona quadrifasciata]
MQDLNFVDHSVTAVQAFTRASVSSEALLGPRNTFYVEKWLETIVELDCFLPSPATSSVETASTTASDFSLWWWRFWSESFDTFGTTSGDLSVNKGFGKHSNQNADLPLGEIEIDRVICGRSYHLTIQYDDLSNPLLRNRAGAAIKIGVKSMGLGGFKSVALCRDHGGDEHLRYVAVPSEDRSKVEERRNNNPHIKVAGRPDDVRTAKEKIMEILDTRTAKIGFARDNGYRRNTARSSPFRLQQSNRVTMKLDVSYTDHSHIIGKGGLTIKRVMEDTGCHIHFPDSNRSNHQEKSNQNLTPLIFSFELPIMSASQIMPDSTSPYVVKIQEKYNVQVMFRTRPKLHATLVVVKGCEWEVSQAKEATMLLIHYMCQNLASQIQVQMSMEISPQHHSVVLGKQSSNLKMIMQRTGTQIMFPDAGDPNIPSLKKSNVTITGAIHSVYLARQQLVGSLPLVLMFDLPEDSMSSVDTENVSHLMQSLDVFINVRHKPKQSTLSVIIKGIERNAGNIYEARKQLLGLDEPRVHAEIPATYHIPNANSIYHGNTINGSTSEHRDSIESNVRTRRTTGDCNNLVGSLSDNLTNILTVNTQTPPYCISPISHSPNSMSLSPHWSLSPIPSMFSPLLHHTYPYPHLNHLLTTQHIMHNNPMSPHPHGLQNHGYTGIGQFHSNGPANIHNIHGLNGNSLTDSKESSAYSSLSSVSSSLSSPAISPRNISPVNPTENSHNLDLSSMLSDLTVSDRRAPGCEKKSLEMAAQQTLAPFDYEQKKILAAKVIQSKPNTNDYRVPTSVWSGYGLSQSIPPIPTTDMKKESTTSHPSDLWKESTTPVFSRDIDFGLGSGKDRAGQIGLSSNYMEHTPSSHLNKITSHRFDDLTTMLVSVGLEKYIRLFTSHEVDMATFPSLTEKDLYEIGITAWGARRKIMLLIAEMNKRTSPFCGSAAPGAERKTSTSSTTSSMEKCNLDTKCMCVISFALLLLPLLSYYYETY